jgi:ferredoxin
MKTVKSLFIGGSVFLANLGASATSLFRLERCTGSCRNCGFSCPQTIIGFTGVGIAFLIYKKLKSRIKPNKV